MLLKKTNAALGLLSIVAMLVHIGYTVFAYLAFYYNPTLKLLTAIPFMVLACLHAIPVNRRAYPLRFQRDALFQLQPDGNPDAGAGDGGLRAVSPGEPRSALSQ